MLKKVFLSPLFKFPIPWMDRYYDNFNALRPGWEHYIFTDLPLESRGNITVFHMDNVVFSKLVEAKTGIKVDVPAPSPKFGDMRPAFGHIFEEYIEDFDYWGHTDFDMVLGDLDKFVPDALLKGFDIFTDDIGAVNGIFTLYRNEHCTNHLYRECENYYDIFTSKKYHAFDETEFSRLVRDSGVMRFLDGQRHEHDKNGVGVLTMNGRSLYRNGREIMAFHFRKTKRWPL